MNQKNELSKIVQFLRSLAHMDNYLLTASIYWFPRQPKKNFTRRSFKDEMLQ